MNILIFNITEFDLLHTFLYEEITFQSKIISDFSTTKIYLLINNQIAACGTPASLQKYKDSSFTYKFNLEHITFEENRLTYNSQVEHRVFSEFLNTPTAFIYYHVNAEELYEIEVNKIKVQQKNEELRDKLSENTPIGPPITEPHLKAQYILKEIAKIIDDNIHPFIAKNDQKRVYKNTRLFEGTITEIPNHSINKEWKDQASLIDVIWFKNNLPFKIFECEISSNIQTGIIRIANYLSSIDAINGDMYIVTTKKRRTKLIKELNGPLFKKLGISQLCKVIFLEDLEALYSLVKLLKGHIKESILDKITYTFEELEKSQ